MVGHWKDQESERLCDVVHFGARLLLLLLYSPLWEEAAVFPKDEKGLSCLKAVEK
jgi:hypothetical protein